MLLIKRGFVNEFIIAIQTDCNKRGKANQAGQGLVGLLHSRALFRNERVKKSATLFRKLFPYGPHSLFVCVITELKRCWYSALVMKAQTIAR
jgi:hypothetical protein